MSILSITAFSLHTRTHRQQPLYQVRFQTSTFRSFPHLFVALCFTTICYINLHFTYLLTFVFSVRLRLFGHIARSSPREDHHQALAACIRQVPPDWKLPAGRPGHTWLRATEADLGPLNFGLATAWRKATTRDEWRHIVDTATLQRSTL